jgi:hypothetical protein
MNLPPVGPSPIALTEALEGAKVPCVGVAIPLAFAAGPRADAIVLDEQATVLLGTFSCYDYTLAASEMSIEDSRTGYMVVTLPAGGNLRRVETTRQDDYVLEVYRVDQGVPVGEPIASCGRMTAFARELALPSLALKFQDRSLSKNELSSFDVRSYPTTPRIGIADPTKLEEVLFFWSQAGIGGPAPVAAMPRSVSREALAVEHGPANFGLVYDLGEAMYAGYCRDTGVDAGQALETALGRYLGRLGGPMAGEIEVSLIIASDTPCVFTFDDAGLSIPYSLLSKSFPPATPGAEPEPKKVLRCRGDRMTSQDISFSLPGGSQVRSASLKTVQSVGKDRLGPGESAVELGGLLGSGRGVYVGTGQWVAQLVTPSSALNATGLAAGLMDITGETELAVEVQDDWQGQPAGKCLAGGKISLDEPGQPAWALLRFSAALILPGIKHWVVVKASKGAAVWLTQAGAGDAIQVLERRDTNGPWKEVSALTGHAALCRFLVDQAQSEPPVVLGLGPSTLAPQTGEKEAVVYDLTQALSAYLQDRMGDVVQVSLTFTSTGAGIITVYPPEVHYEL